MKMKHVRGLRMRWLRSGILMTVGIVVLFIVIASLGVRSYYFNALRMGLTAKEISLVMLFQQVVSVLLVLPLCARFLIFFYDFCLVLCMLSNTP